MRTFFVAAVLSTVALAQSPLTTTFTSNNGQSGNMFDLVATNAAGVTVQYFDVNLDPGTWDMEVYVKTATGPYLPDVLNPAAWTLVGSVSGVVSNGTNVPTTLPLAVCQYIAAGDTQAFYVTCTNGTAINYTNGTATGALYASNADLEFYEGAGMSYPFGSNFNPRIFNGNIYYAVGAGSCNLTFAGTQSYGLGCGGNQGAAQYELFAAGGDLSGTTQSYLWTSPGYVLTDGGAPFNTPTAAPTAFTDDNTQAVALPFSMPTPAGVVNTVYLCSNGWLSFEATTSTDLSEAIADLLSAESRLAFLWDDLNPTSAGSITLEAVGANEFDITFTDVPQFANTDMNTVQVALFDTGNIEVRYGNIATGDFMVGMSSGHGATDLGGTDYSQLAVNGPQVIPTSVGPFFANLALSSASRPVLGTNWDLVTSNIDPVSPIALTFFGDRAPVAIPFPAIGIPATGCDINLITALGSISGLAAGGSATVSLPIPNNPVFTGVLLSAQSIALSAVNPAGFTATNGVEGTLGN